MNPSVIVIGAGIAGIAAGKVLAENGVRDFLILEASNRIGGRLIKQEFAGQTVEAGAGWVQGVGGREINPIWDLALRHSIRTCFSDYSNARFTIYDPNYKGRRVPRTVAAEAYDAAVESANRALAIEATSLVMGLGDPNNDDDDDEKDGCDFKYEMMRAASSPAELALDYMLHDFEMAEVEPIPTYTEYGPREFMIADTRGYEYIVHKLAQDYLHYQHSEPVDSRLKLNKVVREIEYTNDRVRIQTEDGSVYHSKYAIVTASLGVLRSDLIKFKPELPGWKMQAFYNCDIRIYTKIFLKFPYKFWPTGEGTEFFLYADARRGYYTFWQHLENAYPGSNILVVTITDDESKRVEEQEDEKTRKEVMAVLRSMFGEEIPEATDILVPKWYTNRFQKGSYTNYPIVVDPRHFREIQAPVGPIYFSGEHTSEKYNGYVHGGYVSGIDAGKRLISQIKRTETCVSCCNTAVSCSCSCHPLLSGEAQVPRIRLTQAFAG